MNFQKVEFITSAASSKDFKRDNIVQIAFAGKSNVGKSSVINRILQRKNFARVGEQPGKTVHINYFLIDSKLYLVDLPGYGYAKVPKSEKERWAKLMESYFAEPELMSLGVFIVDSRHKPTENDIIMANWFQQTGRPFVVVANKIDKLKKPELEPNLLLIRQTLSLSDDTKIIPFSAEKGDGRDLLVRALLDACGE
ncbi:MAG: ribosome biogenesis GTP-binding protein YihA/YsxC [Clostridia bacterium]|nr:ribosome biogenesis GTP-binding protein YihA/YsxC [Clostridia bacterium]